MQLTKLILCSYGFWRNETLHMLRVYKIYISLSQWGYKDNTLSS